MKDIKCRAWCERTKEYNHYVEVYFYKDGSMGCSASNQNGHPVGVSENYTLEWCLGDKDKNGKYIFEGAILSCPLSDKMLTSKNVKTKVFNFPVVFQDGKLIWKQGRVIIHPFRFLPHFEDCEVIGNIHDNPELITKEPFYPNMKEV